MSDTVTVKFAKLHPSATIPYRHYPAAGFDLYALEVAKVVYGEGTVLVRTGIAVALPEGTYGRIAMRSGLARNQHLCVTAGVVDIDYRGEIGVLVYTVREGRSYTISPGERFAQLIVEKISYAHGQEVSALDAPPSTGLTGGLPLPHTGWGSTGQY